ncbi:plasmid maintenance protein CcdB [Pseudolabrys taiwanensis]|uniref:Toxin CcdB n=1 Tax=Pseudolabrys taiwanensis TaxID=331696 RepID=A0A345ZXK5_9HYPH|nr:CcdB family protein [Pseudolabrys taiwanensis]AXK81652.1 plasmid maintenance protein CcdB [Pseudolabrys taiwanensis]
MLRQFDIVVNPDAQEAQIRPYLVILQSNLLSGLASIIVAPLIARERMAGAQRLNPIVTVAGREYWLATHELFAVDRRVLRAAVGSISERRDSIIAAIDLIFLGF